MDTTETVVVTVAKVDSVESFTLTGKCLMCGDCCRLMCKMDFMLNEKGICKYLAEDNTCDIQAGRVEPDEKELAFWKSNCETFPIYLSKQNYEALKASLEKLGWPTANCGYAMEVTDG